jgi:hypothetical protein
MFGVHFIGNFNLHRLLSDYGFNGYPLRKDFPPTGYLEAFYIEKVKTIQKHKLGLMQEMRESYFTATWDHDINETEFEDATDTYEDFNDKLKSVFNPTTTTTAWVKLPTEIVRGYKLSTLKFIKYAGKDYKILKVASQELCDGMFDNKNLDEDNTALAVY